MTSSKNPVREFIEILRRIRTGHENLKVSSGIPGFIPGTGERVDAFSTALPWESATPDGLFTLKGDKPENPEGLGFAIPANDASKVAEELMTNGYVTGKAYIGVSLYYASDSYTAYRNFRNSSPGLYIAQVVEGYNDDVLKFGDRIIAVDGTEVSSADDVKAIVKKCEIGSTMKFSLYRDGKLIEVDVKCYEYKPEKTDVDFSEVQ